MNLDVAHFLNYNTINNAIKMNNHNKFKEHPYSCNNLVRFSWSIHINKR